MKPKTKFQIMRQNREKIAAAQGKAIGRMAKEIERDINREYVRHLTKKLPKEFVWSMY